MTEAQAQGEEYPSAVVVVPCYNEDARVRSGEFLGLVDRDLRLDFLFVDDGSTDHTAARLADLVKQRPSRISLVSLERNAGKGEAVRTGLNRALAQGATLVGYLDADLATPVAEAVRLLDVLRAGHVDVVLGARVAMLGHNIRRRPLRHYLGRLFASGASLALGIHVYDTQCGAKFFRATPVLSAALEQPFSSRWAFDVELLSRLLHPSGTLAGQHGARITEVPLLEWCDVSGSRMSGMAAYLAAVDLVRIAVETRYRIRRA